MNITDRFRLDKKVAIVTGGGRGLGQAMAHALAEAGADVVIAELNKEHGDTVAEEIRGLGRQALSIETDVSDFESVRQMANTTRKAMGKIDILVNNAGIVYHPQDKSGSVSIPLLEVDLENWNDVIRVNLIGVFNCCRAVGEVMISQKQGNIINIASISSFIANIGRYNNAYCTSKGGVLMFTRQLASEWASEGIRVNAIAPGYMRSTLGAPLDDPAIKDLLPAMTPLKRPGYPEDLKGVVVFLASEASSYIVGQAIIVDGGYSIV